MRTQTRTRTIVIWGAVAIVGAVSWAVIALVRGETISAAWLVFAAVASYAIGYRFYARFIARKVLGVDDRRATPAERLDNDIDFQPTDRRVLFGHHFAAIAGAGPLVGPVLAAQMGYLPGTIWIIVGVIFAGAVQDMVTLFFSMRRDGKSLGQMARDEIGPVGGVAALLAVFSIMIILLAVLALVVVNALAESPWGTFSIAMTIPIAFLMGFYMRVLRPGRVLEVSAIGVALLLLAIVAGGWVQESGGGLADFFTLSPETLTICLIVYGFFASVLPVWMLLAPRDYLSTFMKIGTIVLLAIGIARDAAGRCRTRPVTKFASSGEGPVFAGALFPFVFITIACGALSGFHALIASGTTPKMIQKETQVRFIGYGAMLMESFVAVMAMIAASILDPGIYFAMNAPAAVVGDIGAERVAGGHGLGFAISPAELQPTAQAVEEESDHRAHRRGADARPRDLGDLLRRHRRQPAGLLVPLRDHVRGPVHPHRRWTRARGSGASCCRTRSATCGSRSADVSWKPGLWATSAIVVGAWGYFLYTGVTNPLGGINQLFPLFGIANQLLAAVALTVCTTLLIKAGKLKWAWVTGIPLAWDAAVTLTASWQKVFSSDPKLGFFAQRDQFQTALDNGEVLAARHERSATCSAVVTNSTVDGVLAGAVRPAGHRRDRRRRARVGAGDPGGRAAAQHRGAVRRVEAGGARRAVPHRRGARGARRRGRERRRDRARAGRQRAAGRERAAARAACARSSHGVHWYLREVSGESAYDRYVEHMRADHPDAADHVPPRLRARPPGPPRGQPAGALLLKGPTSPAPAARPPPLRALLDVHAVQAQQVLAEDLALGLVGERRVAVAVLQVLGDLEVAQRAQRPLGLPDRRLRAVDDLVLAAPEQQLAERLGELPRRAHDEVDGGGHRGVEVRVADQLPADLVEERQPDVEDHEVEVGEVRRRPVHVERRGVLDRLRSERHALVDADQVDAELLRLLEHREGDLRVVHPPRERLAGVVADVVELERLRAVLLDLDLHEVERAPALERVHRAPEDAPVRPLGAPARRTSPTVRGRRGTGR